MAISGHEQEFRDLFAQEAEMRLARLGEQLLALEEAGSDEELIASIFREAHNLKGAAAVVGIDDVSRVAHVLEDLLEQLRSGERLASPELIDALLVSVDGLTEMVPAILAGEDRSTTADALEANLRTAARRRDPLEADRAADARPASPPAAEAPTPAGEGPPARRPRRPAAHTRR